MSTRNIIALILILVSLVCLYPGLTVKMFSIKIGTTLPVIGQLTLHETTQSVIQSIKTLHENDNSLVAFLILFFSVTVPVLKALILLAVLFIKKLPGRVGWYKFVTIIGKWSMADVFVVGVLLAYMATRSDNGIEAQLHIGFYYFLSYCIISIIAFQVMDVKELKTTS